MKKLLIIGAFLLVPPIVGCTVSPTPAATQGPVTGDAGQTGDRGRTGQRSDRGQTGDQGRDGHAAPCPAGEHRYTNPDNGRVSCVRD